MLEKEVEKHCNETLCSVCKNPTCTEHLKCREWRDRRAGFYCGVKFGYNKAKKQLTKAIFILKQYIVNCPRKYSFEDIEEMARAFLKEVEK